MSLPACISIDQNSTPLWDPVPKLDALSARGLRSVHYVEDIDAAFTRRGSGTDEGKDLELAPEKYYRDGTSDWGAALFYTTFLGRNPFNPRTLEKHTGLSTKALARRLGLTVDQLYERFSVSDNWQLIGSSYLFDRSTHRVIGDLSASETVPFIRRLLEISREDMESTFPGQAARCRIRDWFEQEQNFLQQSGSDHDSRTLPRLYQKWLRKHLGNKAQYRLTSQLFDDQAGVSPLLPHFLRDYDQLAETYNNALQESGVELTPLNQKNGELPFFAVWHQKGRTFRAHLAVRGNKLFSGKQAWQLDHNRQLPLEKLRNHGLITVSGKALLLVLDARNRESGAPLALPEHGSLYMPAAYALQRNLKKIGIKTAADPHPVLRVKLNFLRRLRNSAGTEIKPPPYLQNRFQEETLDLAEFSRALPTLQSRAEQELAVTRDPEGREKWAAELNPELNSKLREMEQERRDLAQNPETRGRASEIWDEMKKLEKQKTEVEIQRLVDNFHICRISYWNSRGAILPWSIAAGGKEFYHQVIKQAEIVEENA